VSGGSSNLTTNPTAPDSLFQLVMAITKDATPFYYLRRNATFALVAGGRDRYLQATSFRKKYKCIEYLATAKKIHAVTVFFNELLLENHSL
jgi:hypothetical protein